MIGLFKAVAFDPGAGATFRTFAEVCVTRQIITAVEAAQRRKHRVLTHSVPITAPGEDLAQSPPSRGRWGLPPSLPVGPPRGDLGAVGVAALAGRDPEDAVLALEDARCLARYCRATLTGLELEVLSRFLEVPGYETIAAELGLTVKSVDNALQRVRRKVRTYLEAVARLGGWC